MTTPSAHPHPNPGTGEPTAARTPAGRPSSPRTAPASAAADMVYLVAGGDMVAVFDDPDAAATQRAVMEAAGLDTREFTLSATKWETARPLVEVVNPALVITDVRDARADGDR